MSHRSGPRPEALLLDAMGTLIRLRDSVGTSYAARAAVHGIQVEAAAIDRVFPAVLRQAPPLAFNGLQGDDLLEAERRWWAERIDHALLEAGGPRAPEVLHRDLFDHFADPAIWRVFDDVRQHLGRWQEAGVRLGVVSNFDQRLFGILQGFDLIHRFDVVVVSSRAGAAKPSPRPFLLALDNLGLQPSQAWHVGDAPEDALGAASAGMRCLRVLRP